MNSGSKILLGALAGAAVGALAAAFFTEEGGDMMQKISQGSKDIASNLTGKLGDFKETVVDTVVDTYGSVKQSATDLMDQATSKASSLAGKVK